MKLLKENLPWIAPTAAILVIGGVYLERESRRADDVGAQIAAVAATVESIEERPSAAEQLSAILEAEQPTPEVTRTAPLDTAILVTPEEEAPVAVAPEPAVQPVEETPSISDDPAAFFASAQANLALANSCGDDLRALAAEAKIYFPSGGLAGADSGLSQARLLGQVLRDCPGYSIQVEGHSDPSGDPQINLVLSQQRAEAVVARLAASGMDTTLFVPKGFGDVRPSGVTGPEPAAYYDRRVEFSVVEQVQQASFATNQNTWQVAGCAADLEPLFAQTKVYYQLGSITVPTGDLDTVLALASEAASCNEIRMRIVGQHSQAPGSRESIATGRLRALAIMNTLVAAGFDAEQILIGAPSWSESIPNQPGLPNSRVDFQISLTNG